MPNPAFFNLPKDKRDLIISVAMDEFSAANYDLASINQICKKSNIAKGSFYQYFTDKLDLYVYIMTLAVDEKIRFFNEVLSEFNSLTLLEKVRTLFIRGFDFSIKYPQFAALGEQFIKETNENAKSAVIKVGEKRSESLFVAMVEDARSKGEISEDVDSMVLSMLLQSINKTVNEYIQSRPDKDDKSDQSEEITKLVDSLLSIIYNGIKPIK